MAEHADGGSHARGHAVAWQSMLTGARMHAGALQNVPELHVGLRTGYCGSLTTFASWEYSLVTGLIGGAPASTVQPAQGAA